MAHKFKNDIWLEKPVETRESGQIFGLGYVKRKHKRPAIMTKAMPLMVFNLLASGFWLLASTSLNSKAHEYKHYLLILGHN